MKRKFKTLISVILVIAVLSSIGVNGAYATIITRTDSIENVFLPPDYVEPILTCEIEEDVDFTNQTKSWIDVVNTGNIDGYIRLKPNVKWVNDEGQVYYKQPVGYFYYNDRYVDYLDANLDAEFDYILSHYSEFSDLGIHLGKDGYYYYDYKVAPNEMVYFFEEIYFTNAQGEVTTPEGYHFQVEFIAEIIDTETVESVWPVTKTGNFIEPMEEYESYDNYLNWY